MVKILITAFQHSGTTLLRNLINAHPQVSIIFDENRYIELERPKDFIMKMISDKVRPDGKKMVWGEKIPWIDGKGDRAIHLCKKWNKFFKTDARILFILRHPLDVALSLAPGGEYIKPLKLIMSSNPKVINYLNNNKRAATILYEDLVMNPKEKLKSIFSFCDLDFSDKILEQISEMKNLKFGGINPDRAFSHVKKEIFNESVNYPEIIRSIKRLL